MLSFVSLLLLLSLIQNINDGVGWQTFPGKTQYTQLLIQKRQPTIDQINDCTNSLLGKTSGVFLMGILVVTYGNMRERLIIKAETTQGQLHHQRLPQYAWRFTKDGILVHTAQQPGNSTGWRVLSRYFSWPLFLLFVQVCCCLLIFLASRSGVFFFQMASLSHWLSEVFSGFILWEMDWLVNLVIFQDFLELFWGI